MQSLINVGVAQIKLSCTPKVLRTIVGSCVGICIYDKSKKVGGLAHILLPENTVKGKPEKYADTAIPLLIKMLEKEGCEKQFMSAKIAGGASMFKFKSATHLAQIGERNIEMAKKILKQNEIPITAEDLSGNAGRVIDFFLEDGRLKVKASGNEKIYYKN